jgi:hypothetical protein
VRREFDVAAVAVAFILAFAATLIGVRTGWHPADADEIVYRDTLVLMRHGDGFYDAQRQALIVKEHQPPTSVRAIRPPTIYLVLRWFPPSSWRWLVGLVYLADLMLVWRLARAHSPPAGLLAVAIAGVWVLGFATYLFLHAEVWGLPFFLAGLLALRRDKPWAAAALFLAAASIRELYVVGLLGGLVLAVAARGAGRRTRAVPWVAALATGVALYAVHVALSLGVLSAHGYNARFGNEHRTLSFLLRLVAPISSGAGELFGVAVTVLGIVGCVRLARRDRAAAVAVMGSVVLLVASVWATRVYWSACWALPMAAFAPAALGISARQPEEPASPELARAVR